MIREATAADWQNIWPIFREIASAGDTYAYPTDINTAEAEHLWMTLPVRTYVFEREGTDRRHVLHKRETRAARATMSVIAAIWWHRTPEA
jgi:hypothetical protein